MVDVSGKPEVFREALAKGLIRLKSETLGLIREGRVRRGMFLVWHVLRGFWLLRIRVV